MGSFFEHGGASGNFSQSRPLPDSRDALEPGNTGMSERGLNTVSFAGHAASSAQFKALYAEGMGLVEETASYLDGPGRTAAKVLPRMASVLYAAESMRLTTRLMQMASWLLLQRAVNNGEMSREQVLSEKSKVRLTASTSTAARRAGTICRRASATSSSGRSGCRTGSHCSTARFIGPRKQRASFRTTRTASRRRSSCCRRPSGRVERGRPLPLKSKARPYVPGFFWRGREMNACGWILGSSPGQARR